MVKSDLDRTYCTPKANQEQASHLKPAKLTRPLPCIGQEISHLLHPPLRDILLRQETVPAQRANC